MVIISNGFGKFPLAAAAAELHGLGCLTALVTGAYPTPRLTSIAAHVRKRSAKTQRFLSRREVALPDSLVHPMWRAEFLNEIATLANRLRVPQARSWPTAALTLYGTSATHVVRRYARPGMIYHYRSGFGGSSVIAAKERGMVAVCDHSIAHPALLDYLVTHDGRFPDEHLAPPSDSFWLACLRDLDQADRVVVNSDFVKETFLRQGSSDERIDVLYVGPDESFFASAEKAAQLRKTPHGPLRLLFVGTVEQRKGADTLFAALEKLDGVDWQIEIIGPIRDAVAVRHRRLLADPRVRALGIVDRLQLATHMSTADVFAFPSLAEGSARVIPMAMACGCFVITTTNSGSVVEHGRHGVIVRPGDSEALAQAIADAARNRKRTQAIGNGNIALIRDRFPPGHHGLALHRLYTKIGEEGFP